MMNRLIADQQKINQVNCCDDCLMFQLLNHKHLLLFNKISDVKTSPLTLEKL